MNWVMIFIRMKTKVNILDYFAYSNYCWYQFCLKNQDKYWILSVRVSDNPSDSACWLGVCFFLIGLRILSYIYDGLHNVGYLELFIFFVSVISIIVCLYYYFKNTEKTMLKQMKNKSKTKIVISHVCSFLLLLFSFYVFWTIK